MIKRYKLILIALLASLAAACFIAGCSLSTSLDDVLGMYNLECRVTYLMNDGQFEDESKMKDIYYPAGTKPYEITTNTLASSGGSGTAKVELRTGYSFLGWYEVVTNSEGLPLYTDGSVFDEHVGVESGKTIDVTDTKYDFSRALQKDERVFICSKWRKLSTLQLHLVCDGFDKLEIKDEEGNVTATYQNDDVIYEYPLVSDIYSSSPSDVFRTPDYTFVAFYTSLDADERFNDWPVRVPEEITNIPIYARYIEGTWNIVENNTGVAQMFRSGAENYYFLTDNLTDKVIDCDGLTGVSNASQLSGEIRGNGCTIKNLKITNSSIANGRIVSLFGEIGEKAKVSDLTFENIQAEYTINLNADAEVYFICSSLNEKATFNNFKVSGSVIVNLQTNAHMSDISEERWIFGGFESDSDCTANIDISGGLTYTQRRITGQTWTDKGWEYEYDDNQVVYTKNTEN